MGDDEMRERVIAALECALKLVKSGGYVSAMWFGPADGWTLASDYEDAETGMEKSLDALRDCEDGVWPECAVDTRWGVFIPVVVHKEVEYEDPEDMEEYVDMQPEEWVEVCAWRNK